MAKTDTGFIDPGNKGFAVRKLERGPDGRVYVVFVDAQTGKKVQDPSSYNIIEQGHQVDTTSETPIEEDKKGDQTLTQDLVKNRGQSGDYSASREAAGDFNREMNNNYGYYDAPAALSMAGFMGGPVGLAANAANFGISANNEAAINTARDTLGMREKGLFDTVKSMATNKDGYIGDVSYDNMEGSVPVGFEAADRFGRSTLTPNEARMRQQLTSNFQEASPEITKQSVSSFKQENPNARSGGLISGLFSGAKSIFNDLFGNSAQDDGYAFGGDTTQYPDAPELNAEQKVFNQRGSDFSESRQYNDAKDKGDVGLY